MKLPFQATISRCIPALILVAVIAAVGCPASNACSIPVFRYALENWPPDNYHVFIFHNDPLTSDQQALVDKLTNEGPPSGHANFQAQTVETGSAKGSTRQIFDQEKPVSYPWVVIRYPAHSRRQGTLWSGPLTKENVGLIVDSPVRQEVLRRLVDGESAVWVFVDSGNKSDDDEAYSNLAALLAEMKTLLRLPPTQQEDPTVNPGKEAIKATSPVRLSFSLMRIQRDQPQEQVFLKMLDGSDPGLVKAAGKPMVFPIFGQGRLLYPLAGKGMNKMNVGMACSFLVGACSCQVKEENPGVDILMKAHWETLLTERVTPTATAPDLTGSAAFAAPASQPSIETQPVPASQPTNPPVSPKGHAALAVAAALVLLLLAGFVLIRRNPLARK